MKYRTTARGILERENKILFIGYSDPNGVYYSLPGGKHDLGESLTDTVIREFKEEADLDVRVGKIILVREFIISEPDIDLWEGGIHQVETIFSCTLIDENQQAGEAKIPDPGMHSVKWIDKNDFNNHRIYPTNELAEILEKNSITYLFTNT